MRSVMIHGTVKGSRLATLLPPDTQEAGLIARVLDQQHLEAQPCAGLEELIHQIHSGADAAIVAEECLPPDAPARLKAALSGQAVWSDFPLIVLMLNHDQLSETLQILQERCNLSLVARPLLLNPFTSTLLARLRDRRRQYSIRDLLEQRQQVLQSVAASERRFAIATRAGGMAVWEWRPEGSNWSDDLYDLLGIPNSLTADLELFFRIVHPEDRPRIKADWKRAIDGRDGYKTEFRIVRANGEIRWLAAVGEVIHDEQGRVREILGLNWDITELRASTEALRERQRQLQLVADSIPARVALIDVRERYVFVNQRHAEDHRRPPQAIVGMTLRELLGAPLYRQAEPYVREVLAGKTVHFEATSELNGQVRYLDVRYQPWFDDQNQSVLGFVALVVDVSDSRVVALRLEQMGKMIDESFDAIITRKLSGEITTWNVGASRLYGFSESEAIGKVAHELLRADNLGTVQEILRTLRTRGEWVGKLEHYTRDNRQLILSSRQQILKMTDGTELVLEINRDMTEHFRVQRQLERANRAAERANKAKSEFLANMSHELRTPLTAVLGFTEILRDESAQPEYLEKINTIKRNGEYLLRLLNDILDLSKIEAGKIDIDSQPVGVPALMEDLQALMGVRAREDDVPLHFEYETRIPREITADRIRLRQILVNLIGNAIKFSRGNPVRVVLSLHKPDSPAPRLEIAVIDQGIGMTAEQQRELFQPFSQASPETARQFGGTGLGLSISQRLAREMKGWISVESQYGVGSRFTLSLPVTPAQARVLVRPDDSAYCMDVPTEVAAPQLPQISARILLADDRRDIWRVTRHFLEKCGAEVTVAENGQEALDAVEQAELQGKPFALVLMDMQMPVMSGQEAVRRLREMKFTFPIIALTADVMEGERESCIALGCDEYFPKPINGRKLIQMIASLLGVEAG